MIDPGHPEAFCADCHLPNVVWFAPSALWNKIVRQDGQSDPILCPRCFILRAEAAGVNPTSWVISPESLESDATDVSTKTVGILVDELITTDIKCFMAQEVITKTTDQKLIADAARQAQTLNARRNQLIRAIDHSRGVGAASPTEKTYE